MRVPWSVEFTAPKFLASWKLECRRSLGWALGLLCFSRLCPAPKSWESGAPGFLGPGGGNTGVSQAGTWRSWLQKADGAPVAKVFKRRDPGGADPGCLDPGGGDPGCLGPENGELGSLSLVARRQSSRKRGTRLLGSGGEVSGCGRPWSRTQEGSHCYTEVPSEERRVALSPLGGSGQD